MTDHTHDIQRYIDLRAQIAALEAEIETLKPKLVAHVHEVGDRLQFGSYVFRLRISRSWNYSNAVAGLQMQIRDTKRQEVEQGVATIKKETHFVTMTPLKAAGSDGSGTCRLRTSASQAREERERGPRKTTVDGT